jgi:hypothetical protein
MPITLSTSSNSNPSVFSYCFSGTKNPLRFPISDCNQHMLSFLALF